MDVFVGLQNMEDDKQMTTTHTHLARQFELTNKVQSKSVHFSISSSKKHRAILDFVNT